MMTPAGLALFYGGIARYKNLLNTFAMTLVAYCLASVIWMMWGYSIAFGPDILLIGTGTEQQFPEIERYAELLAHNIGVEIMDSPAAARTYNVLVSEGRKVMAGIIA